MGDHVTATLPDGVDTMLVDPSRPASGLAVAGDPAEALAQWLDGCLAAVPAGARVTVTGSGPLARAVMAVAPTAGTGPAVVLDTSNDPALIADAIADLGADDHLVLAALPPADDVTIDAYRDLHRRGLTITAVAPAETASEAAVAAATASVAGHATCGLGSPVPESGWVLVERR